MDNLKEELDKKRKSKAGWTDEEGRRYLSEVDFLKWGLSVTRIKNLRHQASETRTKLENIRLDYEMKRQQYLIQADAFERASKNREKNEHENLVTEMGKKYEIDFYDTNIVIDDETGEIKFVVPPEG